MKNGFRQLVGDARRLKIAPRDALRAAVKLTSSSPKTEVVKPPVKRNPIKVK